MSRGTGRVLVVEDDGTIRILLRELLTQRGFEVVEVDEGDVALEAAREFPPDAVVLDLGLPGMHGLDVLMYFKRDPDLAEIPVLVVTAWDGGELIAKALRLGAHDYVCKPFDTAELGARVEAAVRIRAGRAGLARREELLCELDSQKSLASRTGRTFALLLFDVDHLGAVNERHGHDVGDRVLDGVADRLREQVGGEGVVARWGGGQFMALVPERGTQGAIALADALCDAVRAEPVTNLFVTVSVGCTAWAPDDGAGDLVSRCQRALDTAKLEGRDRVRVASARLRSVA